MFKYELRVENAKMIVEGYNEYLAIMSTGLFEDADMVDCASRELQIWLYTVRLNDKTTIAYVKRVGNNV